MTIRDIRLYGDPVLTTQAMEIDRFDAGLELLARDMLETMQDAGGVGLAGNQVGVLKRIFVFDCSHTQAGLRGAVVNPRWEPVGEALEHSSEGCLSIPDVMADVARYQTVRLRGQDVRGRAVSMLASGLMARCIQHETDHLDGVLFPQRLPAPQRKEVMGAIRNSEWFANPASRKAQAPRA